MLQLESCHNLCICFVRLYVCWKALPTCTGCRSHQQPNKPFAFRYFNTAISLVLAAKLTGVPRTLSASRLAPKAWSRLTHLSFPFMAATWIGNPRMEAQGVWMLYLTLSCSTRALMASGRSRAIAAAMALQDSPRAYMRNSPLLFDSACWLFSMHGD